jgi:hypothetical protein
MTIAPRFLVTAFQASLLAALVLLIFTIGTQAQPPCAVCGAPGPIAGAGLPFFAAGYGIFWLIKRRRKAD